MANEVEQLRARVAVLEQENRDLRSNMDNARKEMAVFQGHAAEITELKRDIEVAEKVRDTQVLMATDAYKGMARLRDEMKVLHDNVGKSTQLLVEIAKRIGYSLAGELKPDLFIARLDHVLAKAKQPFLATPAIGKTVKGASEAKAEKANPTN